MKNQNKSYLAMQSSVAFAMVFAILSPSQVNAAEHEKKKMMHGEKMMDKSASTEKCQAMKEEMKKVMTETKAQDEALATQIAAMNSAAQDKKLDQMAAIVTVMSEQRAAMHVRKAEMEKKMMQHMMEHMEMGKESMSKCPMMKTKNADDKEEAVEEVKADQ